jgi:hypothetical protein
MVCEIMLDIPKKIIDELEKDQENIWIEKHDRLQSYTEFTTLNNENQYKLWKKNCAIRKAFSEISKDIIDMREKGSEVSKRVVGWSEIARKAQCDRNTLKHPIRLSWVTEQREKLLNTINAPIDENALRIIKTPEEEIKYELEKTKSDLKRSEIETSMWFLKFHDILDELKIIQEALHRQTKENSMKDEIITQLKKQLKDFMKQ